jgi:cell wall assembly regulator SMI1
MSMSDYEEAIRLVNEHPEWLHFPPSGVSEARIAEAEAALGLTFPPTYRRFLKEWGQLHFCAAEYHGLDERGEVMEVYSHAVWLTLDSKSDGYLPEGMVVIYQDGMGGYHVIDTRDTVPGDESPVVYWEPGLSEPHHKLHVFAHDFGDNRLNPPEIKPYQPPKLPG